MLNFVNNLWKIALKRQMRRIDALFPTPPMQFGIHSSVLESIPSIAIGLITVRDINNTGHHEELTTALRQGEKSICNQLDLETYREHPTIAALQEVHRSFGNNPNKFPPSIQALIKRILKGGQLPSISPLVDAYNIVSLNHVLSCGGEDTDSCNGDIVLAYADGTEECIYLGETENTPPKPGELLYKDDQGVICGKFDWREGDRTKLTEQTSNAVLVVETVAPTTREQLDSALQDLSALVAKYCGGTQVVSVIDAVNPSVEL